MASLRRCVASLQMHGSDSWAACSVPKQQLARASQYRGATLLPARGMAVQIDLRQPLILNSIDTSHGQRTGTTYKPDSVVDIQTSSVARHTGIAPSWQSLSEHRKGVDPMSGFVSCGTTQYNEAQFIDRTDGVVAGLVVLIVLVAWAFLFPRGSLPFCAHCVVCDRRPKNGQCRYLTPGRSWLGRKEAVCTIERRGRTQICLEILHDLTPDRLKDKRKWYDKAGEEEHWGGAQH